MRGEKLVSKDNARFPNDKVLNKCIDVYSLFYKVINYEWIEKYQFFGEDKHIVMVFDKEDHDIVYRDQRLFIAFHEPIIYQEDLINALEKQLNKNYFNFQFQKRANINVELILNELKRLNDEKTYDIVLCGHSIGGSMAAVTFVQLKTLKKHMRLNSDKQQPESLINLHCTNANILGETVSVNLGEELEKYFKLAEHEYHCVTHGALLFGSEINKDYCKKNRITKGIFNIIHKQDPVPKLFHSKSIRVFKQINASVIGNFKVLHLNKETNEVEIEKFLKDSPISLKEDMVYHKFNTYKTPVHVDGTELDIITRTNKDLVTLNTSYRVTDIKGKGSYGIVLKGFIRNTERNIVDSDDVAIKKIKIEFNSNQYLQLLPEDDSHYPIEENNEIKNLKQLNNKHVVKLFDYFVFKSEKIYLVFEYCDLGSLRDHVTVKYKESELHDLSVQLLDGLEALHEKQIIHRDVKPANTLVTYNREQKAKFCYKLADLGSSGNYKGKDQLLTAVGTELYMSPEIYQAFKRDEIRVKLNLKSDVFSMASLFLFCLMGKHPWSEEKFSSMCKDGFHTMISNMACISNDLKDMLINMLKIDINERFSANVLKNHQFNKNEINIKQSTCGMKRMIKIKKENIIRTTNVSTFQVFLDEAQRMFCYPIERDNIKELIPIHRIKGIQNFKREHCYQHLKNFKELLKYCEMNDNEYTMKQQFGYVRAAMAICYQVLGDFQNAIIENKKALEMFQQLNGRSNTLSIIRIKDNIGNCFYELGNISEAILNHKNSLKMKIIYFMLELTKTDAVWESESKLSQQNITNEKIELNYEQVFGLPEMGEEKCYNIAESLSYLSQCYKVEGQLTKAIRISQGIFYVLRKHDQTKDPMVALIHIQIGEMYYLTIGDKGKSLEHFQTALNILSKFNKTETAKQPIIANLFTNLGNYFKTIELNLVKAIDFYNTSLTINNALYKDDELYASNIDLFENNLNLYLCYNEMNEHPKANYHLEQLSKLNYMDEVIVKKHGVLLANIFTMYLGYENKDLPKALVYLKNALNIRKKIYNENESHEEVAISYYNVGSCYELMEDYQSAIVLYRNALSRDLSTNQMFRTQNNLGLCLLKLNLYDDVISCNEVLQTLIEQSKTTMCCFEIACLCIKFILLKFKFYETLFNILNVNFIASIELFGNISNNAQWI